MRKKSKLSESPHSITKQKLTSSGIISRRVKRVTRGCQATDNADDQAQDDERERDCGRSEVQHCLPGKPVDLGRNHPPGVGTCPMLSIGPLLDLVRRAPGHSDFGTKRTAAPK